MENRSGQEKPSIELPPFRPPGLEMARGLLYFTMVFMVFMFAQLAALVWQVLALSPQLAAGGFSLALLDTPEFQARWLELATNGDVLAKVGIVSDSLALGLLAWLVFRWKKQRSAFFLGLGTPKLQVFLKWTLMFLLLFAALEAFSLLLPEMNSEFMRKVLSTVTNWPMLIIGLGLMPALFEEFLLRGLLYGSLRHLLDKHASVAIVAGVFTLVHQQYDWYILLLYVLPLGIFFGYARAQTGSIWVSVLLHLLNNCGSMLLPQPA